MGMGMGMGMGGEARGGKLLDDSKNPERIVRINRSSMRCPYNASVTITRTDPGMDKVDTPTLRAFALIEHLVAADRPLTLAELTQGFDAPKASLHRMLAALEAGGLVIREPGGKQAFSLGPRLAALGMGIVMHSGHRRQRHAILSQLCADLGESCHLTMLHGAQVLCLDRMEASWPLRLDLPPGTCMPLHCSAAGKLLLALLPKVERTASVRELALTRFTPNTVIDLPRLDAELTKAATERVAVDNEEFLAGIVSVAVPIGRADGRVVAALAVHAPVARVSLAQALTFVPRLQAAASALAEAF